MKTSPPKKRAHVEPENPSQNEDEDEDEDEVELLPELLTELALGSDGEIYINARDVDPKAYLGRKMFHGFALKPDEKELARKEIHRLAFNVPIAISKTLGIRGEKRTSMHITPRPRRRRPNRS